MDKIKVVAQGVDPGLPGEVNGGGHYYDLQSIQYDGWPAGYPWMDGGMDSQPAIYLIG